MLCKSVPMIFKSYNLNTGIAEMLIPVEEGPPQKIYLPLTLSEFGLGMYGMHSWVHPIDLPPSHPNFVTWHVESEYKVTHNRTGEVCYLLLTKDFHVTGSFKLTPVKGGSGMITTSIMYTAITAKKKLEEQLGAEMVFQLRILSLVIDGYVEGALLLNKVTPKRDVLVVFTSLRWMSLACLPINYLDIKQEKPTKNQREKWRKKAQRSK